jgi:phage terminase small subunit
MVRRRPVISKSNKQSCKPSNGKLLSNSAKQTKQTKQSKSNKSNSNNHSKSVKKSNDVTGNRTMAIACKARAAIGIGNGVIKGADRPLTAKQLKFIDEYLVDLNATQAAIRAGYSKRTAFIIGAENLTKPKIAQALQKRRDELKKETQINQRWVLERYKRLVDYDLSDFFDDDGNLKPLSTIPQDALYAVTGFKNMKTSSVNQHANGDVKKIQTLLHDLRFVDKKTALDSIGKHLGMFAEDNNQRRPLVPIQINVSLTE